MKAIVKLRYRHPFGYTAESVWLRGCKASSPSARGHEVWDAELRATDNPFRSFFAPFPRPQVWVTNNMGEDRFRTAGELITHYGRLHGIPMQLRDSTPNALRRFKETASPHAYRIAQKRGVLSQVDQL